MSGLDDEVRGLLAEAARLWIKRNGRYDGASGDNPFVIEAERAVFRAQGPSLSSLGAWPPYPGWMISLPSVGCYVYRIFGWEGELLYIGMSQHPRSRIKAHWRNQPWRGSICDVELESHSDKQAAAVAELMAIQAEDPLHNVFRG